MQGTVRVVEHEFVESLGCNKAEEDNVPRGESCVPGRGAKVLVHGEDKSVRDQGCRNEPAQRAATGACERCFLFSLELKCNQVRALTLFGPTGLK